MLKYKEIIDKLTLKQKLAYLASGRMPETTGAVPSLDIAALETLNKKSEGGAACPSLYSVASSWEPGLFKKLGEQWGMDAKKDGINVGVMPDFSVRTHPYKPAISEDPCLSGALMAEFAGGVSEAGVVPVLSDCSLEDGDTAFMDIFPDNRVFVDYITRPFETALKPGQAAGVKVSSAKLSGNYQDSNLKLTEILKRERAQTLSQPADPGAAADALRAGNILFLNGDAKPLEEAHNNYLKLQESLERGTTKHSEFESLCSTAAVLSENDLDTAVDRLLDFAYQCQGRISAVTFLRNSAAASLVETETAAGLDYQTLYRQAAEHSVVLLKNKNKALPLAADTKVAVIGPSASKLAEALRQLEKPPFDCIGYAEGYTINGERNDAALGEAVSVAYSSSVVLLLIESDIGAQEQKKRLLANQLALAAALCKTGRKVVAVILGQYALDVSFDGDCSAVLFMPFLGDFKLDVLIDAVSGRINPSGRLSLTLYDNTDEMFSEIKRRKTLGKNKIGSFFGYRAYDSAGTKVKYPFGHGLSYTAFSYSKIKADVSGVEFVITNSGVRAGWETAQAYVAKKASDVIRPLKELKGFKKVYLAPGESKVVRIDFNYEDLKVCDPGDGYRKAEDGEYTVFVGASVADTRLAKSFNIQGEKLVGKKESLSDYLDTESNIVSGRYVLETAEKKKTSLIARIVSIVVLLAAATYDIILGLSLARGTGFDLLNTIVVTTLINLLVPAAVTVLVIDAQKRKKRRLAAKNPASAENETEMSGRPALEKLFLDEFAETVSPNKQAVYTNDKPIKMQEEIEVIQSDDRIIPFADSSLTLKAVAEQLSAVMSERGLAVEPSKMRTFVSALYSSRLIVLAGADAKEVEEFARHVSSYFGTQAYMDFSLPAHAGVKEASFINYFENEAIKSRSVESGAALSAIGDAIQNRQLMHFAVVSNYGFPKTVQPSNLWYIYIPYAGALDGVPPQLAETAAVIDLRIRRTVEKNEKSVVFGPGVAQFLKLAESSEKASAAGESLWKRLDKLEGYANSFSPYRLTNKQWRGIEKYVSVYLACEGTETEAADSVVAVKLLPHMLHLIKSGLSAGGDFSIMLENVLGEGNAALSLSVLKKFRSGAEREE